METFVPKPPARHHAPQEIGPDTYLIRQMLGDEQMRRVAGRPATALRAQSGLDALLAQLQPELVSAGGQAR